MSTSLDKALMTKDLDDRYQNQPWHIKLWRCRWLLMIPVWTLRWWGRKWGDGSVDTFRQTWSHAHGWAHCKMEWWFTLEELDERFGGW